MPWLVLSTLGSWFSLRAASVSLSFFFFSSRRRHTRLVSDWSSDVCSSDLGTGQLIVDGVGNYLSSTEIGIIGDPNPKFKTSVTNNVSYKGFAFRMQWDYTHRGDIYSNTIRSEERRVGKECRSGCWTE